MERDVSVGFKKNLTTLGGNGALKKIKPAFVLC
jgi:hypothetical protein